jgi:hypothetical protein
MNRYYKFGSGFTNASLNGFNNDYSEKQIKYSSEIPTVIILGTKWQANKKLNFAADVSYYTDAGYNTQTYNLDTATLSKYEEKTKPIELENTININFGTEYMLDNNTPFRFGFFSDRSTAPKVKDNGLQQYMHVDNYGISIGSGILSQNSTMAFGVKYGWGSGRVTNLSVDGKYNIEKVTTSNYAFNLSGSYNF